MELEEALKRIKELEYENDLLKKELQKYENKSLGGRRKHDAKWQESFEDWSYLYEAGETITNIINTTGMSRRTYYRYKAYYDAVKKSGMFDKLGDNKEPSESD